ncbi:MAG: hypothetical protein R3C68_17385 [Myxococcota bacterium]
MDRRRTFLQSASVAAAPRGALGDQGPWRLIDALLCRQDLKKIFAVLRVLEPCSGEVGAE